MNCCNHDDHDNKNSNNMNHSSSHKNKSHISHLLMMLMCCGAPIILLAAISLIGASFPGVRSALISILPFICPVMMIVMIPMMLRKNKSGEQHNDVHQINQDNTENRII